MKLFIAIASESRFQNLHRAALEATLSSALGWYPCVGLGRVEVYRDLRCDMGEEQFGRGFN